MLRAPGLSICCGFSRNSDYIIVTSQTVKIRHTEKLLQLEYKYIAGPGHFCWSQRNLRSEQTGLSQCETGLTIGVEPIRSEQYKKNRILHKEKVMF